MGDNKVATISFRLDLKVELGKTTVAVRQGAIDEIHPTARQGLT